MTVFQLPTIVAQHVTDTGDSGRQGDDGVSMNALVTPRPVQGTVSCLQDCTGDDLQLHIPLSALQCSVQ